MDLSTDGPLALTIADLRLLLALQAGPADGDPATRMDSLPMRGQPDRRPQRILAASRVVSGRPVDPSVAALFDAAIGTLQDELGLAVEPVAQPIFSSVDPMADWFTIAAVESAHELGRETIERAISEDRLEAGFRRWMAAALEITVDAYVAARRRRFAYVRVLDQLLGITRFSQPRP
jgi:Asp-tRNA(Asn)/Glu-tRNA(Gln) amidotransferase A subunit family amidase